MNNPISKTPFLFLLIPLVLGIVVQYYGVNIIWSIIVALLGSSIILFSFFIKREKQYRFRWIFGIGTFLLFIAFGGGTTYFKQQSLEYTLSDSIQTYVGYVTETPQEKPRSVAHKIYLENEDINVVCYLQKDSTMLPLEVGDEIIFLSQLQGFKNAGNPDDFDYERYMYNQGFVASTYLTSASWIKTGESHNSLKIFALKIRQKIMTFYESLGFEGDDLAILSALTLGYQDTLSDDLKQGFRTTGTVHILSVSGLHVGIIFGIMSFILSFIPRSSRFYRARPISIILLLWIYAFVTGLPPSVIRASAMLTVFCVADLLGGRKHSSLNGLYIAAFCMLFYNPFWIFDIGFQLSFISVLSILVLHQKMRGMVFCPNRLLSNIWNLFCLSIVAQLATFPLCLYYFGTFPTYFFVANLIIVPLVSFITYGIGFIVIAFGISVVMPTYSEIVYWLPVNGVRLLVKGMNIIVEFMERLPFALIENVTLSFAQLILMILIIILLLYACMKYNSKALIASLVLMSCFIILILKKDFEKNDNQLIVYNRNGYIDIRICIDGRFYSLDSLVSNSMNPVIELGDKRVLILNSQFDNLLETNKQYAVDCAIIVGDINNLFSSIEERYNMSILILDSSLKADARSHLTKECENRNIPIHDVTKKGAFSIIF